MRLPAFRGVGLAAAILLGGVAAAETAPAPLRLCADPANLPFSSKAAGAADAPGLYIEIGRAVAEELSRPLDIVWSLSYFGKRNMRSTMLSGQCDFTVGLPATTDFMGPSVIFSRPILNLGYALVVPRGHTASGLDSLKGRRVAVQFASPPQSLLAMRADITSVTVMNPEEGMHRLAAGEADAAFIWGPSASYVNHTTLHDQFDVIPVQAPQMQFQAAIGFAKNNAALRDAVDAVLPRLEARIRELSDKYTPVMRVPPLTLSATTRPAAANAATQMRVAANEAPAAAALTQGGTAGATKGDVAKGAQLFNGTCAHCHGPDAIVADRKLNLRRLEHKYGEQTEAEFFTTVTHGRPAKGMPSWKGVFTHEDFVDIFAYLRTLQTK